MTKTVSLDGREGGRTLAMTLALGALLTTGGCSLVADFGSLDAVGADGGGSDGGGSDGGGNNTSDGGTSGTSDGGGNNTSDGGTSGTSDGGTSGTSDGGGDGGTSGTSDGGGSDGGDGGTSGDAGTDAGAGDCTCEDGVDDGCVGGIDCGDPMCGEYTACCVPTVSPQNEADDPELSSNGIDDDCNGQIDGARINRRASFPHHGGAAASGDVAVVIVPNDEATGIQCRTFAKSGAASAFGPCGELAMTPAGLVHRPFAGGQPPNGAYRVQVRWRFAGDYVTKSSEVASHDVYVHDSLDDVKRCDAPGSALAGVSDGDLVKLAQELVDPGEYGGNDAMAFAAAGDDADTALANPFIKLTFEEPLATSFDAYALGRADSSTYQVTSLRRWFRLSADGQWLIMTRHYESSRTFTCNAASFRKHRLLGLRSLPQRQRRERYSCDAVVVHRSGVGICVAVGMGSSVSLGHSYTGLFYHTPRTLMNGWSLNANPVMGRQLTAIRSGTSSHYENFSNKCWDGPECEATYRPYLPDVALFDWTP